MEYKKYFYLFDRSLNWSPYLYWVDILKIFIFIIFLVLIDSLSTIVK